MAKYCIKCGFNLEENDQFCPRCGASTETAVNETPFNVTDESRPHFEETAPPTDFEKLHSQQAPQGDFMKPQFAVTEPYSSADLHSVMSLGDYVLTFIISAIPVVGLIMMFVWSFSSGVNHNKRNCCRAMLICQAIALVLSIIVFTCIAVVAATAVSSGGFFGNEFYNY